MFRIAHIGKKWLMMVKWCLVVGNWRVDWWLVIGLPYFLWMILLYWKLFVPVAMFSCRMFTSTWFEGSSKNGNNTRPHQAVARRTRRGRGKETQPTFHGWMGGNNRQKYWLDMSFDKAITVWPFEMETHGNASNISRDMTKPKEDVAIWNSDIQRTQEWTELVFFDMPDR